MVFNVTELYAGGRKQRNSVNVTDLVSKEVYNTQDKYYICITDKINDYNESQLSSKRSSKQVARTSQRNVQTINTKRMFERILCGKIRSKECLHCILTSKLFPGCLTEKYFCFYIFIKTFAYGACCVLSYLRLNQSVVFTAVQEISRLHVTSRWPCSRSRTKAN